MKSTLFVFCVVILAAGILCSSKKTAVEIGNAAQILHLGNQTEPQDLDPHIVTGEPELRILSALLEGLVSQDPKDLHPIGGVASRWEISPNGLVYTFYIRDNAQWSNKERLTAHDFVYSCKRMLSPALGAEYAYMMYNVVNAEAYNKKQCLSFDSVGVKAPNDSTFVVTLNNPTPYFLSLLSHTAWMPVHKATIEKFGKIDLRGTAWTRPENFVGNGPFTLKRWVLNKEIIVEKNATYWDAQTVKLSAIHFYPIESAQTEERAFRAGQLHVTCNVPVNKIEQLVAEKSPLLHIDPYLATYYYLFNVNKPPFDNVLVRRALTLAIDRTSIVKNVCKGGQLPAFSFTPHNTAGYFSSTVLNENIDSAKALLARAGYPDGKGFPPVELLYNTLELHQTIAQVMQEMWKKNLNIDVQLVNQEWKVYLDAQKRKDYFISRAGWSGDYNDPNTFLDLWITGGGNNRAGFSNVEYDSLIAKTQSATNQEERYALFNKAEEILLRELPILPIYFYVSSHLRAESVKGWYGNILDRHPYKYVFLETK